MAVVIMTTAISGAAFLQCVGDTSTPSSTADGGSDASVEDSSATDATSANDAGGDAAPTTCAWDKPFNTPVAVPGIPTGGAVEGHPSLSPDELTIYFHGMGGTLSDGSTKDDIFMASRGMRTDAFGTAAPLTINTNFADSNPSISNDGTTLYFDSTSSSDGGAFTALWVAQRSAAAIGPFSNQHPLGSPPASPQAGSSVADGQPFITADNIELWFTSRRDGGTGAVDIYSSLLSGGSFGATIEEALLNSTSSDYAPLLSADRLTVYFSSGRAGGGGGLDDLWRSHRSTVADAFPAPTPVTELNSTEDEFGGWLSPDNCRIYFESQRGNPGASSLYVAERTP